MFSLTGRSIHTNSAGDAFASDGAFLGDNGVFWEIMSPKTDLTFLAGGAEMGERLRSKDWASTPLGPSAEWPQSLKTAVRIMLLSRQPIWIGWGEDLIYLYNDAYKSIIGGKHPWALGRPTKEVWSEIWPDIAPMLAKAMGGDEGTYVEEQLLIMERSGYREETYYTFSYTPIPGDDGKPSGIICANTDDTRRVIGERQLALLREIAAAGTGSPTLKEVCERTSAALATDPHDLPFALIYLGEPDGQVFSLSGCSPLGSLDDGAPKTVDGKAFRPFAKVLTENGPHLVSDLESICGTKIPQGFWSTAPKQAALVPIPARGETARPGILVAGLNPFRTFDEHYRNFITLAAGEIGASIANAEAHEAERRRAEALAEIDRAKTVFFSNVSHEFRTPLTLILGPLEDLRANAELPNKEREQLDSVHRNSIRLLKLVNSLLDFSRIEAGRAQAKYQPTDLANLTADLTSNFRSACERAGLRLVVDCRSLSEPVYVDPDMWEKIVLNLLSNAFKFTFTGEIAVRFRIVNGKAELRVSDTGVGIPQHELPRLFERFHRIEGQTSRTHEGSGIGLALVQELVKLHSGSITAESLPGQGTTFTVTLPLGSSHLPHDRIEAERTLSSTAVRAEAFVSEALRWLPSNEAGTPQERLSETAVTDALFSGVAGGRILVADDNSDMRAYIYRLLGSTFEVQTVSDGEAAIEAIRQQTPDLVLSDVMMPRIDGLGLVRTIRTDPALTDLPVILLSARADEDARLEGLDAGADDYLVKPFNGQELIARISANLKLAKLRKEATQALQFRTLQFETLLNNAPIGVYLIDSTFRIREANPTALPVFGDLPGGVVGRDLDEILHILWEKDYADEVSKIFHHTLDTGEPYFTAHRAERRLDRGTVEHYEWRTDRITLPDGTLGVVCYFRDIADQVQADNTKQLLLRELNHRVKNTLAMVQAIAQQTIRSTKDPADFASRFSGRVQSLAKVHSLLTDSTWTGTDLKGLICDQLLQGTFDESRLTAWGPAIHLEPQMAVHLALMLHEMGTNSAKYGALSSAKGWVTVKWSVSGNMLNLQWTERGGPVVSAPKRRGFGTILIERSAESEGGHAEPLFEPEGITWNISMTLRESSAPITSQPEVTKATSSPGEKAGVADPPAKLAGLRFIVVEDESLIALDLADRLERWGAVEVSVATTEKDALRVTTDSDFDCALLDANLHGSSVNNLAAALTRRKIPFVFVTGYGRSGLPSSFKHAPVLAKPVSDEQLIAAIREIAPSRNELVQVKH